MNTVVELQRVVQERTDIEKNSNMNPGTLADHDQTRPVVGLMTRII